MIVMGAGTNHWFHSDQIYRAMLNLVLLCGCQGVNGGGWAHYVGQEKVRPITGWSTLAFALDWTRPPRQQATTPYWFLMSDQWRYQRTRAGEYASPLGRGTLEGMHLADTYALASRLGWTPSYPSFDRNPLELADAAAAEGLPVADYVVRELQAGRLRFAAEDPDGPGNYPRVLTLWRANLLGSSSKGHEYFLRHVLGVEDAAVRNEEAPPELRSRDVVWREEAPVGKFDLFTTIDFRMNGSALYSDVVLPAATWYEKHDLSSTDLHPFVHSFNPAVPPPWETRTDFDVFKAIARSFAELAETHLGVRTDVVAAPLPTTRRTSWRSRSDVCWTGEPASASRSRGRRCRSSWPSSATTRPSSRSGRRSGRSSRRRGSARRASPGSRWPRSTTCGSETAPSAAASPTAARAWPAIATPARRSWRSRG
jgi:nitrate reductase alpha subunit